MHKRLRYTTDEEADEDVPNEVKHIFPTPVSAKVIRSNSRTVGAQPCKNSKIKARHVVQLELLSGVSYRYSTFRLPLSSNDHRHAAPCAVVRVAR